MLIRTEADVEKARKWFNENITEENYQKFFQERELGFKGSE